MSPALAETDVARPVVAWLADQDWDAYQEVSLGAGQPRADIVATRGPLVLVCEVKRSLGLALIAQGEGWLLRGLAHYVVLAAPWSRRTDGQDLAERVCQDRGLGLLRVGDAEVREKIRPRIQRRARADRLVQYLHEAQKTEADAGSAGGGYWTPFRATCRALQDHLRHRPGSTIREAMDAIDHHYSSPATARGAIRTWVREGKVPGVRLDESVRPARLYMEGQA